VITLQDYSRLRARIRYRLKAIRSATQSAGTWQKITSHSGLRNLLTYLDEKGAFGKFPVLAELDPPESSPLVSSSWLGGDAFRLEAAAAPWKWGEKAKVQWESVRARHQPLDVLCPKALAPLSAGHRILAASPVVPLTPGRAASALDQEHVHFQVCPDDEAAAACRRAGEESLGVILVLTANLRDQAHGERLHSCAIPLSGCCFLQPYGMEDDYWSIKADDLVDAAALAARIKAQTDPLSAWLWKHLGDGAQKRLDEPGDEGKASPGAVHVIREVLNEFLDADPTGLVGDFTGSPLPAQSLELLRTATERGDSARVCREIIEQVYPKAIRRRPKSDLLLQIRLDCGHLLESFPDLVAKAELGRVKGHFLQIYVSSAHS
jgi:hypothetical protein